MALSRCGAAVEESEVLTSIKAWVEKSFDTREEKRLKTQGALSAQFEFGEGDSDHRLQESIDGSLMLKALEVSFCDNAAGRRCIEVKLREDARNNYRYFKWGNSQTSTKKSTRASKNATSRQPAAKRPTPSRSIHRPMQQGHASRLQLTNQSMQMAETPAQKTRPVSQSQTKCSEGGVWTRFTYDSAGPEKVVNSRDTPSLVKTNRRVTQDTKPKAAPGGTAVAKFEAASALPAMKQCFAGGLDKENRIASSYQHNVSSGSFSHGQKRSHSGEPLSAISEGQGRAFGLRNLGNTCFMNAVMQVICSLREFVSDLSEFASGLPKGHAACPILECTLQVVQHMSGRFASCGPLDTTELRACITRASGRFGDGRQHDAHEFFLEFVDRLHTEMRNAVDPSQSCPEGQARQLATGTHLHSQVLKKLTCVHCKDNHSFREPFSHFSLDLEGNGECVLESMLKAYFANEVLSVKCEKCGRSESIMEKSLATPPQVLVLHLKRFLQDPQSIWGYKKLNNRIKFPKALDLGGMCKRPTNVDISQDSVQEISSDCNESVWYDLRSVIVHDGYAPHSGHYVAYACSETGVWQLFNDSSVKEVPSTETLGQQAYMLVYQRRTAA